MQIIATGLETALTVDLEKRLQELVDKEDVESFVLGMPTRLDGTDTDTTQPVLKFRDRLGKLFPGKEVILWDEQFTSKMAMRAMINAGVPKKKRRDKALVDQVSATIILQDYLANSSI